MNTQHRIDISILNDCYGSMLTAHQTEMIRLYYDCDVSLNEIAEQYSISRQAVRDALLRGEKALVEFENNLHVVEKTSAIGDGLRDLLDDMTSDETKDKVRELIKIVEGE